MFILEVILIMEIVLFVQSEVLVQQDHEQHLHSCTSETNYLTGLVIPDPTKHVGVLKCNRPSTEWDGRDTLDEYPKWSMNKQWLICSNGYFLNGFYGHTNVKERKWDFTGMVRVRCVKPASHPVHYGDCFTEHLPEGVNYGADCRLKGKFFMVGVHANVRNVTAGIVMNSFKCCTMAQKPYDIHSIEQLKERIMATKLKSMAELADGLGFVYCAGVKGTYCGDDFRHDGNHWNAEESEACNDRDCVHKRLHIFYDDWKLVVKNISYGKRYTDNDQIETIDYGTLYNYNRKAEVTETFVFYKTIQETVTHYTTSGNSSGRDLSVSLNFELPLVGTMSASHINTFKISNSQMNQTVTLQQTNYKTSSTTTLKPLTLARYNVTVSKSRTVIPYTATVIATFSVRLEGTLKGTYGVFNEGNNFHYHFQRESKNLPFNYTFGDKNIPFYTALKKESETQSEPWLWKEMESKRPKVRRAIDNLIDEKSYEFSFTGNLEHASGRNVEVFWNKSIIETKGKESNSFRSKAKTVLKKKKFPKVKY